MNIVRPTRRYFSYLAIAAFTLLLAALGFGIWNGFFKQSSVAKGLSSLQSAYHDQRPVESRISSLDYAPFLMTRGSGTSPAAEAELRHAELTLIEAKGKTPTAETLHALGQLYLAQKRFEDAVHEFEEALKTEPNNPMLLSDMGAAWLEKGKIAPNKDKDPNDNGGTAIEALGYSLTYLNQALAGEKKPRAALFNRALCFQYLRLPVRAQAEWRDYLARDSTSQWAEEARRNLELLEQHSQSAVSLQTRDQMLNDFLGAYDLGDEEKAWKLISISRDDLSGTSISQQLLDKYLDSSINGRAGDASRQLQALTYVGELEVKRGGEHYNADLTELCKSMTLRQKTMLSEARNLMRTGYKLYEQSASPSDIVSAFAKAAQTFEQAGDRVQLQHARFWIAYCEVDSRRALDLRTDLATNCARLRYRWLLMRTIQSISSAKYDLKEYSKAIEYSQQALELADEVGDQIGAFNALDSLTELYRAINNYEQAMNSISRSQPLLDCCAFNPIKIWRHYGVVAFSFYSAGFYAGAIEYEREALRRALVSDDPEMVCLSYVHLGLMLGKLGEYEEGLKNARLGYETAASRATDISGKRLMAYASLQLGHLEREMGDCENALKNYDESIAIYEGQNFLTHLYQGHKGRLLCYIKQNNDSQAGRELQTTLSIINNNRSTIFEADDRNKFFDIEQSVYDLGIEYAFDRQNDRQTAFAYSEDSRARSLLDLMESGRSKGDGGQKANGVFDSLPLTEIQRRLPEAHQVVEYTVLEDKTLIWVVNKHGDLQVGESKVSRAELESRVTGYLRSISTPSSTEEEVTRQGKELFDLLIRPVEKLLDRQKQVNIIPDKILNSLPFDSLVSTTSGKYLIQDYCLSYAPSASVLALASEKAGEDSNPAERILTVGNPSFDQKQYGFLPDLKDAVREARQIRDSYSRGAVLVGPAATKRNVLDEMRKSDVVHLAVHSIEEPYAEMHSKLVLAKDSTGASILEARELYDLELARTRLVVLSACQTGTGRYYRGEGTFSLARAFLVSGVPVVVASLWPIDSEATTSLMIDLHQIRREQHVSSAEALRRSQLKMLSGAEQRFHHPYYWAAFSVFGGCESFTGERVSMR